MDMSKLFNKDNLKLFFLTLGTIYVTFGNYKFSPILSNFFMNPMIKIALMVSIVVIPKKNSNMWFILLFLVFMFTIDNVKKSKIYEKFAEKKDVIENQISTDEIALKKIDKKVNQNRKEEIDKFVCSNKIYSNYKDDLDDATTSNSKLCFDAVQLRCADDDHEPIILLKKIKEIDESIEKLKSIPNMEGVIETQEDALKLKKKLYESYHNQNNERCFIFSDDTDKLNDIKELEKELNFNEKEKIFK